MHVGSSISHYRIVEKLGEGGMGVVYKAEDTKLERTVALKFLADHLLNDEEAKQRFLREAKAAAALHHPNVCPVHEIDEVDGKTFLAMAFLKGETLEDRIAAGPLPIKDALEITRQVAEGLDAAHEAGIVHRDIKPANVLVDAKGHATIMDFGLARLTEASRLTKVDTAMGTVAYMSPEQAQGMEVDSRTDIWALGCVLYEMVSGQRPFLGQYDQALLYEIVHEEVAPLTSVRAGVPMELEFIVADCLAKDRDDRTSTAQDLARKLRTLAEKLKSGRSTILRTSQMTGTVAGMMTGTRTLNAAETLPPDAVVMKRSSQRLLQALAALATLAFVVSLAVHFLQAPEPAQKQVARFSFPAAETIQDAAISPDGKHIAYTAGEAGAATLWVRSIDGETAREIPATVGAMRPFWSPDSRIIGFGTPTALKTVPLGGGVPTTLCDLPARANFPFLGGTWSPDGQQIVFSSGLLLHELAAVGGDPKPLFERGDEDTARPYLFSPHFLPAGGGPDAIVYVAGAGAGDRLLMVMNLESGERRELVPGVSPAYSSEGYLLYGHSPNGEVGLRALPFSRNTLSPTGDPFPIDAAGRVASISDNGILAYRDQAAQLTQRTLVWRSRKGEVLATVGQPQQGMAWISLSPDERWVALSSTESGSADIWIHDLDRSAKTRLTFDAEGSENQPTWSPSGDEVTYQRQTPRGFQIVKQAADGTGQAVELTQIQPSLVALPKLSSDGRYLIYHGMEQGYNQRDIYYTRLETGDASRKPMTFLNSPANEREPNLSPDGRLLAYETDESGRPEVYIRPFPDGAGKWQVSARGGMHPLWRSDGRELYYVQDNTLMAVSVSTEQGVTLGQPQALFESQDLGGINSNTAAVFAPSADGQRFLTAAPVEQGTEAEAPKVHVVLNWYEEFRDRQREKPWSPRCHWP